MSSGNAFNLEESCCVVEVKHFRYFSVCLKKIKNRECVCKLYHIKQRAFLLNINLLLGDFKHLYQHHEIITPIKIRVHQ